MKIYFFGVSKGVNLSVTNYEKGPSTTPAIHWQAPLLEYNHNIITTCYLQ